MTGSTARLPTSASASASLEQSQKQAWLRAREELRQAQIVTVNQGLSLTPSLYFGTRRCTYSTVVSVVTTALPLPRFAPSDLPAHSPAATAPTLSVQTQAKMDSRWLEEREQDNQDEAEQLRSPYMAVRAAPVQQRQALALRREQRVFMQSLQAARRARARQEHEAALVIQRVRRGFVLRRNFRALKQKLLVRKRIRGSLLQVTKGTAIVLGEKDRRARVLAAQSTAACRIQGAFRGWGARRLGAKLRALRRHEQRVHCASVLQRAWRACLARWLAAKLRFQRQQARRQALARLLARLFAGFKARYRVRALRLRRQARAAATLQSFVRRRLLAAKARTQARARRAFERHHDGAIRLQRLFRGVLQRARVIRLRRAEQCAVLVACALMLQRVARGFLGRQRARRRGIQRAHERGWVCAIHVTRLARGFLARLEAARERDVQEGDLLVQARRGNVEAVVDLLDGFDPLAGELEAEEDEDELPPVEPADVGVVSPDSGNGVLHLAAKFGHLEVVTLVLPRLMDVAPELVYARNFAGLTPLALAVLGGHERVAVYLLTMTSSLFVDRVRPGRRRTLLHEAARRGLVAVVAKLLQLFPQLFSGGERDAWTQRTALHEALLVGVEVVEDETAQPWTRHHSHVHQNAQSGVDAEEEASRAMAVLETVLAKAPQAPLDAQDFLGFTALHVAAARGNLRAVTRLLAFGADVGVHDAQGRTAWRVALLCNHEACFQEIRRKWLHDVVNNNNNASQRAGSASVSASMPTAGGSTTPTTPSTPTTASSSRAVVNPAAALVRSPALHPQLGRELFAACEAGDVAKMRFFIDECDVSVNTVEEEVEVAQLDASRATGEPQDLTENETKGDSDTGEEAATTDPEATTVPTGESRQEKPIMREAEPSTLAPQRSGGRSLLMVACELQDARAVAFLLGRPDLDLHFTTRDGRSALSVAQAQAQCAAASPLSS